MVTAKAALKHLHNTLANAGLGDKAASDAELQNLSTELQDFNTLRIHVYNRREQSGC